MFLKNYATESRKNQSIDEKIEALVVHLIFENNLGYRTGYFWEIKTVVENAFRLAVASFKFVQEYRDNIIRDQTIQFGRPILRGVWY